MDKPYRLSPLAEADLEEIWLYTLRHWSVEQAGSCLRNLVAVSYTHLTLPTILLV